MHGSIRFLKEHPYAHGTANSPLAEAEEEEAAQTKNTTRPNMMSPLWEAS